MPSVPNESLNDQVLVDIPVQVQLEPEKVAENEPKRLSMKTLAVASVVAVMMVVGAVVWSMMSSDIDLEFVVPKGGKDGQVKTTPDQVAVESGSAVLTTDTYTYINKEEGFSIVPPEGWKEDDSKKSGLAVVFLAPNLMVVEKVGFATIISVEASEVEGVELADQIKGFRESMKKDYPDFEVEEDMVTYIQSRQYQLYTGTYEENGVKMRKKSLITIYNDRGYAISATGPVKTWDELDRIIAEAMFSFRLL